MAQGQERTSGRKMISCLGAYQTPGVGKELVVPRSPGRSLRDWTHEGGGPSALTEAGGICLKCLRHPWTLRPGLKDRRPDLH